MNHHLLLLLLYRLVFCLFCLSSLLLVVTGQTTEAIDNDKNDDSAPPPFNIRFLLVNGGSEFFRPVLLGFNKTCNDLHVDCDFLYKLESTCEDRIQAVTSFVQSIVNENSNSSNSSSSSSNNNHDPATETTRGGIAYRPCGNVTIDQDLIQLAARHKIPVVEFDASTPALSPPAPAPAPSSTSTTTTTTTTASRIAYVGTNNRFMGQTMAKLLRQLRPEGGTFTVVAPKTGRYEGFVEEIQKDNGRQDRAHWYGLKTNFTIPEQHVGDYMYQMQQWAKLKPTAMIFMKQSPMRHQNWTAFVDQHRNLNITLIGADGSEFQLDYLDRRYVDGLVGQLPYEFGVKSAQVLYQYLHHGRLEKTVFDTNVVAYNLIPVQLPPLQLDENLIGNLHYVGYSFFGIVVAMSVVCIAWTWYHRQSVIVRAAQPFFLFMIVLGVVLMAGALIPLSFDDGGVQSDNDDSDDPSSLSKQESIAICMSIPWLAFTGFTVTFAALFSKTWRVNRIFGGGTLPRPRRRRRRHHNHQQQRQQQHVKVLVRERDVLLPFAVLFTLNIIVLVCWTVVDPLTYVRLEDDGTDFWNRAISTSGSCQSDKAAAYLIPLALINGSILMFASWQAYVARDIKVEFSEALYIGHTMSFLVQGFLTGIPLVVIVRETPQAFYLVLTLLIFLLCIVTLGLIFLPKVLMQRKYSAMSEADQKKEIASMILQSSVPKDSALLKQSGSFGLKSEEMSNMIIYEAATPKHDNSTNATGLDPLPENTFSKANMSNVTSLSNEPKQQTPRVPDPSRVSEMTMDSCVADVGSTRQEHSRVEASGITSTCEDDVNDELQPTTNKDSSLEGSNHLIPDDANV